jgi:hypothetical protein
MMARKLFISGLGVGSVAVVMVGVSLASASTGKGMHGGGGTQHNSGQTLRFTAPPPLPQDQKQVDVPPRGLSLGDEIIGALSLRKNGQLFGRALVDCTINDQTFAGQQCTLDLVLRSGLITAKTAGLDRLLPRQLPSSNDVFAVTGGTGPYTGADGTITIIHGTKADTFVVRLPR